ncbi:hypothetical protein L2735_02665 [Shewanella olleyana]|uniref:hypothetical protein n=1 Tax=Shewanella olleyana TaxID=135626 RepID=UPI00200F3CFC|nr:hypothetical protein [Shewanella olleyana]MCL1065710.1 hypothetical protein [Shewanella olleyana]
MIEPSADKVYALVEGACSLIPMWSVVLHQLAESPIEKRREKWRIQVTDSINSLIEKKV